MKNAYQVREASKKMFFNGRAIKRGKDPKGPAIKNLFFCSCFIKKYLRQKKILKGIHHTICFCVRVDRGP